ncbi:hypothetical protein F2P81_002669 [Scophthalmus maximus]|uniref:Uncharacterized protein n=1 Tax=Scophthalmus maximus TaxID=52904 RepID=A0A6A4TRB0_SCOMX|nr:hypothetical protein F2P81_002669 [Scophthalmus maximus]
MRVRVRERRRESHRRKMNRMHCDSTRAAVLLSLVQSREPALIAAYGYNGEENRQKLKREGSKEKGVESEDERFFPEMTSDLQKRCAHSKRQPSSDKRPCGHCGE